MVTKEMVKYWLGEDGTTEILKDYKDIANGKYEPSQLKRDIMETWISRKEENE